jgi:hypothetical protein
MPAPTLVPSDALALGPGYLFYAPLGTAAPTNTVAGSVFTDAWTTWVSLGVTESGHEFSYELKVDPVEVEEYLDPVQYVTTGRQVGFSFELAQIHATNMKRAINGGTITVTGTGATTLSKLSPPKLGAETRAMIGWESTDGTERMVAYRCFQQGGIKVKRKKGAEKATIPVEFLVEQPADGTDPFNYWTAGTIRG